MASCSVRLSPDRAVPARALAGIVLVMFLGKINCSVSKNSTKQGLVLRLVFAVVPVYARSECGLVLRESMPRYATQVTFTRLIDQSKLALIWLLYKRLIHGEQDNFAVEDFFSPATVAASFPVLQPSVSSCRVCGGLCRKAVTSIFYYFFSFHFFILLG